MFVRAKKSGAYEYLQLVHNERADGKVRQQVIATLDRQLTQRKATCNAKAEIVPRKCRT